MKNQHCKVGATTDMTSGPHASTRMISHYQFLMSRASDSRYAGTQLGEFFERKAKSILRYLEKIS